MPSVLLALHLPCLVQSQPLVWEKECNRGEQGSAGCLLGLALGCRLLISLVASGKSSGTFGDDGNVLYLSIQSSHQVAMGSH